MPMAPLGTPGTVNRGRSAQGVRIAPITPSDLVLPYTQTYPPVFVSAIPDPAAAAPAGPDVPLRMVTLAAWGMAPLGCLDLHLE